MCGCGLWLSFHICVYHVFFFMTFHLSCCHLKLFIKWHLSSHSNPVGIDDIFKICIAFGFWYHFLPSKPLTSFCCPYSIHVKRSARTGWGKSETGGTMVSSYICDDPTFKRPKWRQKWSLSVLVILKDKSTFSSSLPSFSRWSVRTHSSIAEMNWGDIYVITNFRH